MFDWTIILIVLALIVTLYAQIMVHSNYKKYSEVASLRGATGREVAKYILSANGLDFVRIEPIDGELADHYDPRDKTLRLSPGVYDSSSISAISIAAHEAGHAIQDAEKYAWMSLRSAVVPVANVGSTLSWISIFAGFFIPAFFPQFLTFAIICYSAVVAFTLITLPVEFNASQKALKCLSESDYLYPDELPMAKKVLNAAAMTYVAAAFASLMTLLRFILIRNRS